MASFSLAVDASCPLCGARILSVSRAGQVLAQALRLVPLEGGRPAGGYMLCDDCGVLTSLPPDLSLN